MPAHRWEPQRAAGAGRLGRPVRRRPGRRTAAAVAGVVAATLLLCLLVGTFVARLYWVPSGSMEPGLLPGDRVAVDLLGPRLGGLHRGDLVVFRDTKGWLDPASRLDPPLLAAARAVGLAPAAPEGTLLKRVVGLPGDTVAWTPGEAHLRVNGVPVAEPYLADGLVGTEAFAVTVPARGLWVLGDHRAASADSRSHREGPGGGFVSVDDVVGRAAVVVWPLGRVHGVDDAQDAFAAVPAAGAGR